MPARDILTSQLRRDRVGTRTGCWWHERLVGGRPKATGRSDSPPYSRARPETYLSLQCLPPSLNPINRCPTAPFKVGAHVAPRGHGERGWPLTPSTRHPQLWELAFAVVLYQLVQNCSSNINLYSLYGWRCPMRAFINNTQQATLVLLMRLCAQKHERNGVNIKVTVGFYNYCSGLHIPCSTNTLQGTNKHLHDPAQT